MANNRLFREEASKAVESPERLDESLKVISNFGWLALVVGGIIFIFTFVWGIWGAIEEKVQGLGLLTSNDAVPGVYPYAEGNVIEYYVKVGDAVKKGQLLARISLPGYESILRQNELTLNNLINNNKVLTEIEETDLTITLNAIEYEKLKLQLSIEDTQLQLKIYQEQANAAKDLYEDGVMSEDAYQDAVSNAVNYAKTVKQLQVQLDQLTTQVANAKTSFENNIQQRKLQIMNQKAQVDKSKEDIESYSKLTAGFDGTITEISISLNEAVSPSQPVILMEKGQGQDKPLEAIIYVSAIEAKKIQINDQAEVSPTIIRPSQHGAILGRVKYVSPYPVTTQRIQSLFSNQVFINEVTAQGTPLEVHIELLKDPSSPNGYKWTSGTGPDIPITNGTLTNGMVVVETRLPISYIMPFFRKLFLGEDSEGIYYD